MSARLIIGLLLSAAAASPDPVPQTLRVLPPETGPLLKEAFRRAAPVVFAHRVSISHDRVEATVCDYHQPATCFAVQLGDPQGPCAGQVAGPWCVTFPAGQPPVHQMQALLTALGRDAPSSVWVQIESAQPPESPAVVWVWLLVLGTLALPALLGWLGGRLTALIRGRPLQARWAGFACVGVPVIAAWLLPPHFLMLGFWDLLMTLALVGAGFFLGAHSSARKIPPRNLALVAVATGAALFLLELGCRLLLPTPPVFPDARSTPLLIPTYYEIETDNDLMAGGLFPDDAPGLFTEQTRGTELATSRVLHVGDSMVRGSGLPVDKAFPAVMQRLDPGTAHVNAGVPGTGPDYYYALIQAWVERLRPEVVVVHLFDGNDFYEMDAPYACCRDRPLLVYAEVAISLRCDRPAWSEVRYPPRFAVAPYIVRVASEFSVFARHLRAQIRRLGKSSHEPDDPDTWAHLELILRTLQGQLAARGVQLVAVHLPTRAYLENPPDDIREDKSIPGRMRSLVRDLGIPAVDANDLLVEAVRREGSDRWFLNEYQGDIHFSEEGNERLGAWLLDQLKRRDLR